MNRVLDSLGTQSPTKTHVFPHRVPLDILDALALGGTQMKPPTERTLNSR